MERNPNKKEGILLPQKFKLIGGIILALSLVIAIVVNSPYKTGEETTNDWIKTLSFNTFLLGLLFIVISKDKIEDEMTISLRLRAIYWSFIWAIVYVIVKPLIDLISKSPVENLNAREVVMGMLILYLTNYYLAKALR